MISSERGHVRAAVLLAAERRLDAREHGQRVALVVDLPGLLGEPHRLGCRPRTRVPSGRRGTRARTGRAARTASARERSTRGTARCAPSSSRRARSWSSIHMNAWPMPKIRTGPSAHGSSASSSQRHGAVEHRPRGRPLVAEQERHRQRHAGRHRRQRRRARPAPARAARSRARCAFSPASNSGCTAAMRHHRGAHGIDRLDARGLGARAARRRPAAAPLRASISARRCCTSARRRGSLGQLERLGQQLLRAVGAADAGDVAGRLEQPRHPPRRVGREARGALGGAHRGRRAAAGAGRARRLGERRRDLLVGRDGRRRQVPRAPLALQRGGERAVRRALLGRRHRAVGDGAQQRVAERQRGPRRPRSGRRPRPAPARRRSSPAAASSSSAPDSLAAATASARRVGSGSASSRWRNARSMPAPTGTGSSIGSAPLRWASLSRRDSSSSASGLPPVASNSRVGDLGRDRPACASSAAEAPASSPSSTSSARRRADRLAAARREQQHDALLLQPAGDEHERLARRRVEPRRVVDRHEHGRALADRGQQAERRGVEREAVAGHRRPERERARERRPLRRRQRAQLGHDGAEQVGEAGERELGLGLDAARAQHRHPVGGGDRVVEQRALADPRLAADHERGARSRVRPREQLRQAGPLCIAAEQHVAAILGFSSARRDPVRGYCRPWPAG